MVPVEYVNSIIQLNILNKQAIMARYLVSNYDCLFVCRICINLYIRGPPCEFLSFFENLEIHKEFF